MQNTLQVGDAVDTNLTYALGQLPQFEVNTSA